MAHIKRAKVAEEAKKEAENPMKGKLILTVLDSFKREIHLNCQIQFL